MKPAILFILHLPPPVHGAAMVGKYIHDSKLINEAFDCHYVNLTTAKDLQDIGRSGAGKLWRFVRLLWEIRRKVKAVKPQLVYVTPNAKGRAFYKDFFVVQMLKAYGCRIVCHYHNKGVRTRQDKWLDNQLYKRFFKGIKVILLADVLYNDIQKYVKKENVYICPNGIPETMVGKPSRPQNEIPRLLFVSNLLIEKGVLVLLDALKMLKDKDYSFVCDFVGGETAEMDAIRFEEEVWRRGLSTMAVFRGGKYGEDKQDAFNNADIFVFPTYNETFGLVNLEAMEHGIPVVSTNEGGIPDVVKNGINGTVCNKNDEKALADAIEVLLNDQELRIKMGEEGYKAFKNRFTIQHFERNFSDILTAINSGGGKLCLVKYRGSAYGEKKAELLQNADIFVFPTYYHNECFPLVLLEAMQYGIACISTNEGGIADIVDDCVTGYLTEKRNVSQLAEKIASLITDRELCRKMGKAGREKYEKEFALPCFEKRLTGIICQIQSVYA